VPSDALFAFALPCSVGGVVGCIGGGGSQVQVHKRPPVTGRRAFGVIDASVTKRTTAAAYFSSTIFLVSE